MIPTLLPARNQSLTHSLQSERINPTHSFKAFLHPPIPSQYTTSATILVPKFEPLGGFPISTTYLPLLPNVCLTYLPFHPQKQENQLPSASSPHIKPRNKLASNNKSTTPQNLQDSHQNPSKNTHIPNPSNPNVCKPLTSPSNSAFRNSNPPSFGSQPSSPQLIL